MSERKDKFGIGQVNWTKGVLIPLEPCQKFNIGDNEVENMSKEDLKAELIKRYLTGDGRKDACGYYDENLAKFLNGFLDWYEKLVISSPRRGASHYPNKVDLTKSVPFNPNPEKTVFDEIAQDALDEMANVYEKFENYLKDSPTEIVQRLVTFPAIRAIYSEMAQNGYAYELITKSSVEGTKINLTGYIQWYQNGEKRTQDEFDAEFRRIFNEMLDGQEQ